MGAVRQAHGRSQGGRRGDSVGMHKRQRDLGVESLDVATWRVGRVVCRLSTCVDAWHVLGLSHECLQRASETSRRGRHHLDSGGGTRSAAAVGQSPSHLWQGTVAARSLALTTESAKLARSESAMSSHQRLRRGNAARLGCFEGSASPPACATPGQQPRAAAAGWLAGYDLPGLGLLASVGAHYSTAHDSGDKAGRCVRGCRRWLEVQQTPARPPPANVQASGSGGAWAHREARCSRPGCPASLAGHSRSLARSLARLVSLWDWDVPRPLLCLPRSLFPPSPSARHTPGRLSPLCTRYQTSRARLDTAGKKWPPPQASPSQDRTTTCP